MPEPSLLGEMPAEHFLRTYWQHKPLLLSQVAVDWSSPLSAEELAGLALEEEVESRLITQVDDRFRVQHGPFDEDTFINLPDRNWTLLVQAVDLWVDEVSALHQRLAFLPPWRRDDIMVSYATPGGGVGPHFDHYDVFLLQVEGEREWHVGQHCEIDEPRVADSEMHLLAGFETESTHLLKPGDALYLPPRRAHWGTAVTESLTFSIGFRAPRLSEMLDDLVLDLQSGHDDSYLRDPPLNLSMAGEHIDPAFVAEAQKLLRELLDDQVFFEDWFARFVTTPKYPHYAHLTGEQRRATIRGLTYVNGEPLKADPTP